jgi:hypothetical protein
VLFAIVLAAGAARADHYRFEDGGTRLALSSRSPSAPGLRVEAASRGYPGLVPGDVILAAGGKPPASDAQLLAVLRDSQPAAVQLRVLRAGQPLALWIGAADYRRLVPPLPLPPAPPVGR